MAMGSVEKSTRGTYEFSAQENEVVGKTAGTARAWGIVSVIVGGFALLQALLGAGDAAGIATLVGLIQGVVSIVVGVFFVMTATALKAVVDTEGDDVAHMMVAMQKLGMAFTVQLVAVLVGFVVGVVAGAMGSM